MAVFDFCIDSSVFTAFIAFSLLFCGDTALTLGGLRKMDRRKVTSTKMQAQGYPYYTNQVKGAQSKGYFLL
jgi:hypothetical protein